MDTEDQMKTYLTTSEITELIILVPRESELVSLSSDVTVVVELSKESACWEIIHDTSHKDGTKEYIAVMCEVTKQMSNTAHTSDSYNNPQLTC